MSENSFFKTIIEKSIIEHSNAVDCIRNQINTIIEISFLIKKIFDNGGILFLFGNGGSAADAQHIAAELIGRYKNQRVSLPAIALTTDTSALTAIGNDFGFEYVFSRQIEGLVRSIDGVIGISTSGKSRNVILGLQTAREKGCATFALTGNLGAVAELADMNISVPNLSTARVQEIHIMVGHLICELLDFKY